MGLRQLSQGAVVFVFQYSKDTLCRLNQCIGVRQSPMSRVQLLPLISLWCQLFQFGNLPLKSVTFLLQSRLCVASLL